MEDRNCCPDKTAMYGARRLCEPGQLAGSPSPVLERVWEAAGLTAAVGTDTEVCANDFDKCYPWSAIRTCNIQVTDGRASAVAYEGDPSFRRDGSNGPVAVEIPRFYCPPRFPGDGYEYWGASGVCHEGWYLNPAFLGSDGKPLDHTYIAAYEIGESDGHLTSASGLYPAVCQTIGQLREKAAADGAFLYDFNHHCLLEALFVTEFATLDSHTVMSGSCDMPYSNREEDVITNEGTGNLIHIPSAYAAGFVVGQTIGIGYKRGKNQITAARRITRLDPVSGEMEFDGAPLPIAPGLFVYTQGWCCGSTDSVLTPSGSPVSNNDNRHCCRYRGIENLWGSLYDWVDGCFCQDGKVFLAQDPELSRQGYSQGYRPLAITVPEGKGFPTVTGYDPTAPWVRLPTAYDGSRDTYSCDFVYSAPGLTTMRVGGHWGTPNAAGLHGYAPFSPEDYSGTAITGRLMWRSAQ